MIDLAALIQALLNVGVFGQDPDEDLDVRNGIHGGRRDGRPPRLQTTDFIRLDLRMLIAALSAKPTRLGDVAMHYVGAWGPVGFEALIEHDGGALGLVCADSVTRLRLVTSPPSQWLAICPNCVRRRGVLFGDAETPFRCAKCLGLAHTTSAVSKADRARIKASRIVERLGCDPLQPERPKWMRRRRFARLAWQLREAQAREVANLARNVQGIAAAIYRF